MKINLLKSTIWCALAALIVIIAIVIQSIHTFRSNYSVLLGFDPKTDYTLPSSPVLQKNIPILISNGNISWPETDQPWDTGFLRVDIEESIAAGRYSPRLSVTHNETVLHQDFETGVSGYRYINISALSLSGIRKGSTLQLTAKHLSLNSDNAELILFNNTSLKNEDVFLFLAPHPDDAEIAASGLYQQYNSTSWIVTITAGEAGGSPLYNLFDSKLEQYQRKADLRIYDSVTIPQIVGIPPIRLTNLGYFDGTIKKMYENKHEAVKSINLDHYDTSTFRKNAPITASTEATWVNLVSELSQIITNIQPTVIVTPHPLMDTHSDHQYTTLALLHAIRKTQFKDAKLLMYSNHTGTELYPFGDRESQITIPYLTQNYPVFEKVFSFPLTDKQLSMKLLSIDLMHDLKIIPKLGSTNLRSRIRKARWDIQNYVEKPDKSYYRRAIRPNELFYVIDNNISFANATESCLHKIESGFSDCSALF